MLVVAALNAFYGTSQVVFDLDLKVRAGEIVTLLGRNGAGKTSTLMAIAGTVRSKVAGVRVAGQDISALDVHRRVRAGLALVPSGARVFTDLTVAENLGMMTPASGNGWTVDDVYEAFPPLAQLRRSRGGTLSGGERQMLAVGRAMLARPKVLMLDEPSEGLGPKIVDQVGHMLRRLSDDHGLAILLTEQNHRIALRVADRAAFIEKGKLAWEGIADEAADSDVIDRYLAV
jgi:branched-chain amino acid transport system ATP-binding protein